MFKSKVRRYFFTGLAVLLPIIITVYILFITIRFADNLLGRFINPVMKHFFGVSFFGLGLLAITALIFITGILAANVFVKKIMPLAENALLRVPFFQQIYPSVKQFIKFLFSDEKVAFKKVVLLEYPRKDIYAIGFITNELVLNQPDGEKVAAACVYIATSPNPVTGSLIIVPKKELVYLKISVEEACKIIISGGVVFPDNLILEK